MIGTELRALSDRLDEAFFGNVEYSPDYLKDVVREVSRYLWRFGDEVLQLENDRAALVARVKGAIRRLDSHFAYEIKINNEAAADHVKSSADWLRDGLAEVEHSEPTAETETAKAA